MLSRVAVVCAFLVLLLVLTGCGNRVTVPFSVTEEDLESTEQENTNTLDRFLTLESDVRDWFTTDALEALRDEFCAVYPTLCDMLSQGVRMDIRIRLAPLDAGFTAEVEKGEHAYERVIVLNPSCFKPNCVDFSVLIEALAYALLDYVDAGYTAAPSADGGAWITEGISAYARYVCTKDETLFPEYREGQSYTDSRFVTARFFAWLTVHIKPTFVEELHEALMTEPYTKALFVTITGYSVDELWNFYAASDHGVR